jgi:hypothetical protein
VSSRMLSDKGRVEGDMVCHVDGEPVARVLPVILLPFLQRSIEKYQEYEYS